MSARQADSDDDRMVIDGETLRYSPVHPTVEAARSRCNAAQRRRSAGFVPLRPIAWHMAQFRLSKSSHGPQEIAGHAQK